MEYMKVYKSMMKFFGKCMMIKEGKEVPMTVLSLIVEMMGWIKDELMNVGCVLFTNIISYYSTYCSTNNRDVCFIGRMKRR